MNEWIFSFFFCLFNFSAFANPSWQDGADFSFWRKKFFFNNCQEKEVCVCGVCIYVWMCVWGRAYNNNNNIYINNNNIKPVSRIRNPESSDARIICKNYCWKYKQNVVVLLLCLVACEDILCWVLFWKSFFFLIEKWFIDYKLWRILSMKYLPKLILGKPRGKGPAKLENFC